MEGGVAGAFTGVSTTIPLADLLASATLVAITARFCEVDITAGAVYRPADEIVPTAGLNDQVTA